jgi:hypothetical protein
MPSELAGVQDSEYPKWLHGSRRLILYRVSRESVRRVWSILDVLVVLLLSLSILRGYRHGVDILSHYGAISSDGFDWIIEGRALAAGVFTGWPIQRNPGYVALTAGDALAGGDGIVIIGAAALAVSVQWLLIRSLLHRFAVSHLIVVGLSIVFAVAFIQFVSYYVLSDSVAVAWLLASVLLLARALDTRSIRWFGAGVACAVVGSQFQTYALMPVLCAVVVSTVLAVTGGATGARRFWFSSLCISALGVVAVAVSRAVWRASIGHSAVPEQLTLLKLSTGMLPFYEDVWLLVFLPLAVGIVLALALRPVLGQGAYPVVPIISTRHAISARFVYLVITLLCIATFFYQWPESRFTYSFFGLACVGAGTFISRISVGGGARRLGLAAATSMAITSVVLANSAYPLNVWQPVFSLGERASPGIRPVLPSAAPYAWYSGAVTLTCSQGAQRGMQRSFSDQAISQMLPPLSPYELKIGLFGIRHCL